MNLVKGDLEERMIVPDGRAISLQLLCSFNASMPLGIVVVLRSFSQSVCMADAQAFAESRLGFGVEYRAVEDIK
ncbi:hypothetical protein GB937_008475 [Aspergillus fischeri]|nr:hypothetical protein GB937_008475 [Aspergillus fischeri]